MNPSVPPPPSDDRLILSGMTMLIDHQWIKDKAIVVEDKRIKAIIPSEMISHHLPAKQYVFPTDHWLIPGLIDLHIHGAAGHDVMDGSEEALRNIGRALAKEGVTGFLATTMSADAASMEKVLAAIAVAMSSKRVEGAAILGVHVEGPFIAKEKKGAQAEAALQLPDVALIKHWQHIAHAAIKRVTLAPELPQALLLIKALREMNVGASIGHTYATYAETLAAINAGAHEATHLFNAMRGLHQREPGALGALLLDHDVVAELIVDGVHLHPAIVELAFRLKGKERLILVTDAIRAKCLGDGEYELGGNSVSVRSGQAMLSEGILAGSTLRMTDAIKNMVAFSKCSLLDAIAMASFYPARLLNLHLRKGMISVGHDADMAVLDADFKVMLTLREGVEVFRQ